MLEERIAHPKMMEMRSTMRSQVDLLNNELSTLKNPEWDIIPYVYKVRQGLFPTENLPELKFREVKRKPEQESRGALMGNRPTAVRPQDLTDIFHTSEP